MHSFDPHPPKHFVKSPRLGSRLPMLIAACAIVLASMFQCLQAQVAPTDSVRTDSMPRGKGAIKAATVPSDTSALIISGRETDSTGNRSTIPGDSSDTRKRTKGSHAFKLHLSPKKDYYEPKIAVRRSAIIPGWGQIYCNRIWKVPIVYGGFAVFITFIIQNDLGYKDFDRAFKCAGNPNSCVPNPYYQQTQFFGIDGLLSQREQYRRTRDFNAILCGLWYVLNVVDAYVDSHLRNFNVSDDLSLNIDPSLQLDPLRPKNLVVGASLTLNLRK